MSTSYDFRFHTLPNGLRLATERLPGARSVSIGVLVKAGARHEAPGQEGMAHLWEHLAFKGTSARSALDIAKELDLMGGQSNAYTSRETTVFHAKVTDRHMPDALDILSDIVLDPTPTRDDLERETDVVLQEIAMVEDDPEDCLMESFWCSLWPDGSLGHSILGTPESVKSFDRKSLVAWRAANYRPERMLLAAAGNLDHDHLAELAEKRLGSLASAPEPPVPASGTYTPGLLLRRRESEQNHVVLSFPGLGARDERRFALSVLNAILGGNMSSRLFQEIRERRGLAYSVYSFVNALEDRGVVQVYAAVDPERTPELLACLREELTAVASGEIVASELDHARDHLTSLLYLSLESSEERMSRLSRNYLLFGRHIAPEETAARFEAVTLDEVSALAAELIDLKAAGLGLLGPTADPAWEEIIRL
ncbi:pitrilysin family protein [Fundidesulfovibrio butyratiphilus]